MLSEKGRDDSYINALAQGKTLFEKAVAMEPMGDDDSFGNIATLIERAMISSTTKIGVSGIRSRAL